MSRGSKSRNKVSVGEPAEGSLSNTRPRRQTSSFESTTTNRKTDWAPSRRRDVRSPILQGPRRRAGVARRGRWSRVARSGGYARSVKHVAILTGYLSVRSRTARSARPVVGRGSSRTSWTRFSIRSSMFVRPARFKESCGTRRFSAVSVQVSGRRQPPEEAGASRPARSPRRHLVFLTSVY